MAVQIKGTPNIIWGSANTLGSPTTVIVESLKVTDKNGSPIEIEGNDGHVAVVVLHTGEFDADATVVYDANKTWPAKGDTVVLQLPKVGAAGGLENFNCYLTQIDPDVARKREAMLSLKLIRRPGVLA